jgi:hypothetical protein
MRVLLLGHGDSLQTIGRHKRPQLQAFCEGRPEHLSQIKIVLDDQDGAALCRKLTCIHEIRPFITRLVLLIWWPVSKRNRLVLLLSHILTGFYEYSKGILKAKFFRVPFCLHRNSDTKTVTPKR